MSRYRQNTRTALEVAQSSLTGEGGVATDQAFVAHYSKTPAAASATGVLGATAQTATTKNVTTGITQPDAPRNVTITGKVNAAQAQVETATVAGAVTGNGDAKVTITAAGLEGSPLEIGVTVAEADDASAVAGKIRTALGLNAAVAALFTISGATDKVILTKKVAGANDDTLNIAIDNSTCTGLTAAPTSADTTAGLAKSVGNVVVTGKNVAGEAITETIALNGTTEVVGNKAFASISNIALPAKLNTGDTVSVGTGSKLGLNYKLKHNTVVAAYLGDAREGTLPTVAVSGTAVESNTALLNSALNGSAVDIYYLV